MTTLFLARSLDRGGAERQLVALAKGLATNGHQVAVAVFYAGGVFDAELAAAGVRLINLDKKGRWDVLSFLIRLLTLVRDERPVILHSYLTVPNLLTVMLKFLTHDSRIIWGVRASNMDLSRYDKLSRLSYWLECRLSRFADLIIANSQAGKQYAADNGFCADKIIVIPNGIDTAFFRFDLDGRQRVRSEWKITEDEILVGLTARLDPMKDHATFIAAANIVTQLHPNVRFVCIGSGPDGYAASLKQRAASLGYRLLWVGPRDDMSAVYSALDIASSSSSFGEGFSNTIAEAMACSRPCVVTDVGDSAWIVGNTGGVVSASNPEALATGLLKLINLSSRDKDELGSKARIRVEQEFAIETLITRTEQILGLS
ncbi:MAG: glycosyltransferase [Methylococcaceae bacterium]|nr:glycosyltransferase [Methylococcaceae bacterium]MDP3904962.1 glycosyltransferase [Methylococcaceae bacterium]